jgi:hypothetical protein
MSKKETLTIEVDARVKDQLERTARVRNVSLSQVSNEALLVGSQPQCPTCGRPNESATAPAGMSEEFRKFVDAYKPQTLGPATITTLEAGKQKVYWVRIRGDRDLEGMLMVWALLGPHGNATLPIGIPLGVIPGWRGDSDGTWYGMCVALGYEDGNAPARQVAILMRQQGQL